MTYYRQKYKISVKNLKIKVKAPFGIEYEQSFAYYESAEANIDTNGRASGAYIFKPTKNVAMSPSQDNEDHHGDYSYDDNYEDYNEDLFKVFKGLLFIFGKNH